MSICFPPVLRFLCRPCFRHWNTTCVCEQGQQYCITSHSTIFSYLTNRNVFLLILHCPKNNQNLRITTEHMNWCSICSICRICSTCSICSTCIICSICLVSVQKIFCTACNQKPDICVTSAPALTFSVVMPIFRLFLGQCVYAFPIKMCVLLMRFLLFCNAFTYCIRQCHCCKMLI